MDKQLYPRITTSRRVYWEWFANQVALLPLSDQRKIVSKALTLLAAKATPKQKARGQLMPLLILWTAIVLALTVSQAQARRDNTVTSVTVTNASTQMLAGSTGIRTFLSIDNESATATIACSFGATAAANTAGSYTIGPGLTRVWNKADPDFPLNGSPINCISSAATSPATIESNP